MSSTQMNFIFFAIFSFTLNSVRSLTLLSLTQGKSQTLYNVSVSLKIGDRPTKLESTDREVALKMNQTINEILNGTTNWDLPSINPLVINELHPTRVNVEELLLAHLNLKNINIWGLQNLVIKKLETHLESMKTVFSASIPKLIMNADYSLRGNIFRALAYNPHGQLKTNLTDLKLSDMHLGLKTKNNIVQITSLHGNVYLHTLKIKITGLLTGKYKLFQGFKMSLSPIAERHKNEIANNIGRDIMNYFNKLLRKYTVTHNKLKEYLNRDMPSHEE